MNDTTIDPQKDAQATEEMLAMLDALEQNASSENEDETGAETATSIDLVDESPSEARETSTDDSPQALPEEEEDDASHPELPAEPENAGASSVPEGTAQTEVEAVSLETPDTPDSENTAEPGETAEEWGETPLDGNDALESLVPDAPEPDSETPEAAAPVSSPIDTVDEGEEIDSEALPQKALHTLETAAELKHEADELAAEVSELEQETASAAVTAAETLQDETEQTQLTIESTLAAAEQAFNILRERGIAPASGHIGGMDADTLMEKLAELEARNRTLKERNEAIKARLAALK